MGGTAGRGEFIWPKERRPWKDLATGLNYQWDITGYTEPETSQRYTVKRSGL